MTCSLEADRTIHYVDGSLPGEVWAHFGSGVVVRATRDRSCHFPRLKGTAPETLGLYRRFDELSVPANHVLDAGCGSGEGLRHLCAVYRRVTGVDRSTAALSCAGEVAPHAQLVHGDIATFDLSPNGVQVAYIVDVLGHIAATTSVLLNIGRQLKGVRRLCVAEPRSSLDQRLDPPQRRAFTERALHSVLIKGGFRIEELLNVEPGFVAGYAVCSHGDAASTLHTAESQLDLGRSHVAETLARRACVVDSAALRVEALLTLARIQVLTARKDAATATLLEAQAIDPSDARPRAGLALLARASGADSQAYTLAREAVLLDPWNVAAMTVLATLLHDADPKQALQHWTAAHALAPAHEGIVARLCDAAIRVGELEIAITALGQSRRFGSLADGIQGSLSLAWLLLQVGRTDQAAAIARQTARRYPDAEGVTELVDYLRCTCV